MKFMKIGTRPDTFYTEQSVRTLISDVPSDLSIQINNITYLLHKFALLPRCGLLQRLCSEGSGEGSPERAAAEIELHDIPGGAEAFELCAKFCYGITIDLSAHNVVGALCAAKFLRMSESVERGNLVVKLESFFNSCILEGWKDSVVALQTTVKLPEWSENLGIIRKCIDSVVEKILTPPAKVSWSYTYTRPGYNKKQQSVPKDWWTEDVSDLDIDMFRCIVTALRCVDILTPRLIGEALHVYASRWLPDTAKLRSQPNSSSSSDRTFDDTSRRTLEAIVSMIPSQKGSVSVGFLLRLLSAANLIIQGVSPATKAELLRKCGAQLEDGSAEDLLFPAGQGSSHYYDIDLVQAVVESFLVTCRRQATSPAETGQVVRSLRKVGRLVDRYLQVVARDVNMPVSKVVALAESVPDVARLNHDDIYLAIDTFLKEHPDLNKAEKKQLCRILDCQKLTAEVRAHAVKNERLPLRTVVQLLFFEQERGGPTDSATSNTILNNINKLSVQDLTPRPKHATSTSAARSTAPTAASETGERVVEYQRTITFKRTDEKLPRGAGRGEIEELDGVSATRLDVRKMSRRESRGRDR